VLMSDPAKPCKIFNCYAASCDCSSNWLWADADGIAIVETVLMSWCQLQGTVISYYHHG
jgi:hypothetical protein